MGKYHKDSDDTHDSWWRGNSHRSDDYTSKKGDGETHCHYWSNKDTGESGVEHRGACKVCDDKSK